MQRIVLGVALAFATFSLAAGSPLAAQQNPPDQQSTPTQSSSQPVPQASDAPPPPATGVAPLPPPFPPMPSSRPSHRWVDMGGNHARRTEHHAKKVSHHKARASHRGSHASASASHRRSHASASASHRRSHAKKAAPPSPRVMRRCHKMSYKQIMRSDSCRALMRQDLAASAHSERSHRHKVVKTHRAHTSRQRHHSSRRHR